MIKGKSRGMKLAWWHYGYLHKILKDSLQSESIAVKELAKIVVEMDLRDMIVVQGGYERKLAKIIVEMDLRDTIVVQGDYERELEIIVVEMALYRHHHWPPFSPS